MSFLCCSYTDSLCFHFGIQEVTDSLNKSSFCKLC